MLCQQGVAITTGDEDPDAAADLAPYAGPLDAFFSSGTQSGIAAFHKPGVQLPYCLPEWAGGGHDRPSMHVKSLILPGTSRAHAEVRELDRRIT